ncbi:ABC transporter ATP-binding protein [Enemella sp. A6]|uniref:ABC transporter ATP-binding protein n=1 Tax=Enemella sp. A6 TaxID=3440152 RepID=UPI003EBED35A
MDDNLKGALEVRHLQKTYRGRHRDVEAIRDLNITVAPSSLVCIVGPSGAGKTTLLKCMAGLLKPTSGSVVLHGEEVTSPPRGMAIVFQEYQRSLFPWLTVAQNVELPLKELKLSRAERHELVTSSLESVGLGDAGDLHPWQLSGGMQQRVAIARAVAYQPEVLIMDEPFAAVDAQTRADLEDLVRKLWKDLDLTVLFVTHDIDESVYLGERVIVLSAAPTVVMADVEIDLPAERDQIGTRSDQRFAELRTTIYQHIQAAKRGERPDRDDTEAVAAAD